MNGEARGYFGTLCRCILSAGIPSRRATSYAKRWVDAIRTWRSSSMQDAQNTQIRRALQDSKSWEPKESSASAIEDQKLRV